MNLKKLKLLVTAVVGIALSSAGCSKQGTETQIVAAHAIGLCNMPLFVSVEQQTAQPYGAKISLVDIPNWGDHPAALASGKVDVSITPFTTVISAYANGLPLRIIAGSGLNGLYLLGQSEIKTIDELRGKKIGTFRADTLEVAAYDALKKAGMSKNDFQMVYFTSGAELMTAFANHSIDAMTHVEPYATQAVAKYHAQVLSKGQDVWGGTHPDCVLTTTEAALRDKREALKALIAGMFKAESFIETKYGDAVDMCLTKYYKADRADIMLAGQAQPPGIDIRDKRQFIIDRSKSLMELGYISKQADNTLIDFSLLGEVISEHPDLLAAVKVKAPK